MPTLDIDEALLKRHLRTIAGSYIDAHDEPPAEVTGYKQGVIDAGAWAEREGQLDTLKLAIEHVLGRPDLDAGQFASTHRLDDGKTRELLGFARTTLWPAAGPVPAGGPPDVRLIKVPPPPAPPFRVQGSVLRAYTGELVKAAALDENAFNAAAQAVFQRARTAGHSSELRIGIDHLLGGGDLAAAGLSEAGSEKAVRAGLQRARSFLWPDVARPAAGGRGVVIV